MIVAFRRKFILDHCARELRVPQTSCNRQFAASAERGGFCLL